MSWLPMTLKAQLRANPTKFAVFKVAHELGLPETEVQSWSAKRLRDWMTYFQVTSDLEKEAFDKAREEARRKANHTTAPGYR